MKESYPIVRVGAQYFLAGVFGVSVLLLSALFRRGSAMYIDSFPFLFFFLLAFWLAMFPVLLLVRYAGEVVLELLFGYEEFPNLR